MTEKIFNLLDETWIIVTNMQGKEETLSLTDVLVRSHELRSLSGEMPTQDIAILRLLLGVLYAIYTRTDEYKAAQKEESQDMCVDIWRDIWVRSHFPQNDIEGYLKTYHDRFWLIHPERPFYQVATMEKGSEFTVAKMIGELVESGNKIQLFPMRSGKGKTFLNYPESVRWLLYLNSFDDIAAKKKDSNAGSMTAGWLGVLDLVYLSGNTLFETLMFNLSLLNNDEPWSCGKAAWELNEVRTGERTSIPMPKSGEELYTLQSRRIQFKWRDDKLIGFALLGGDQLSKEEAFAEPMTQWRKRKGGKGKSDTFAPPGNEARYPTRQIWRDLAPLLVSSTKSSDNYRRPGILNWISELESGGAISSRQVQICTMSIKYGGGSNQSGIDDVWGDSLSINASLLSSMNDEWIVRIINMVEFTENLVKALGILAINIAKSAGASDIKSYKNISTVARESAYASFDTPFRKWIAAINPKNDDMDETCNDWAIIAKSIILDHGENLVSQAGEQAFVGKMITENKKGEYYSAPKVYGWFKSKVYKELSEKATILGVIENVKENV